jgi:hypothetical protein
LPAIIIKVATEIALPRIVLETLIMFR